MHDNDLMGTNVLEYKCFTKKLMNNDLTVAQEELFEWIRNYIKDFHHSPSIRQMMDGMGLKSPAPIQSRLKHLQEKVIFLGKKVELELFN